MMPPRPIVTSFVPNGASLAIRPSPISVPGSASDYLPQMAPASLIPAPPPFHFPNYTPGPNFAPGTTPQGELGRELGVDEYLSLQENGMLSGISGISPIDIPTSTFLPRQDAEQHPCSSFPSAFGSLTSGPTLDTAPMSRCNSNTNDGASISNQFNEMVRIQSQHSVASCRPSPITTQPPPLLGKRASEDSGIIVMQGGAFSYAYPPAVPSPSQPPVPGHQHPMQPSLSQSSMHSTASSVSPSRQEGNGPYLAGHLDMERSVSHDSIKSNLSLKFRAKEALARQNYAAKSRHLQPKPATGSADDDDTAEAAHNNKDGKAAISKTKYERPKHPKVLCNQCTDHPEGFRGEHELRRHTEAKHKSMVKKWICRDPALHNIPHNETAVKPLHECKQCSQNKQYGAYYNAAAHLRRTHFKVKPRKTVAGPANGKNGGQHIKVEEEREKRGGKGGGDWPPMAELKQWMIEVIVPMDQAGAVFTDGVESIGHNMDGDDAEDLGPEFADASFRRYSSGVNLAATAAARGLPIRMMTSDGFEATAAFAGMGEAFSGQTIDLTTFHGDLDAQLADMYRNTHNGGGNNNPVPTMFTQPSTPAALHGMPLSSSGFDYRAGTVENTAGTAGQPLQQQNGITSSIAALDGNSQGSSQGQVQSHGHGYTSPVSSTATVTQAAVYMDQLLPPANLKPSRDDVADMPFDLTFTAMGQ